MQNFMQFSKMNESAGDFLRFWRKHNKMSQMDLAFEIGISPKHLSFIETGRSRPSRNMVLKIGHFLKLPLRHRNAFLKAAGYSSEFGEEPLDGEKMKIVRQALKRILEKHKPYPAFVVNAVYKIIMTNSGYEQMVNSLVGKHSLAKYENVYHLTFSEDGLRPYIKDWPRIEQFMLNRLLDEAASTQNSELFSLYDEISQTRDSGNSIDFQANDDLPIMSLTFEKDGVKASFFTTLTTLGTPLDLTAQELRIECLFPADEATKKLFTI